MIDADSASASEILAAAIQDSGRGVLAGEKSFGKGLGLRKLALHNKTILLSVFEGFSLNGSVIDKKGVEPHFKVYRQNALPLKLHNHKQMYETNSQ